jgi:putative transposase
VNQAVYPIAAMCRVLGVAPSGYYAWRRRGPSARAQEDARLSRQIQTIHTCTRGTYGVPRVHAELTEAEPQVGCNRVARLMRGLGLQGVSWRKGTRTTLRHPDRRPAPDLVQRDVTAQTPSQLWVADITYSPTWAAFLYLAVVLDAFSRRVVGWAMATHLRAGARCVGDGSHPAPAKGGHPPLRSGLSVHLHRLRTPL